MVIRTTLSRKDFIDLNLYLFPLLKSNWIFASTMFIAIFAYQLYKSDFMARPTEMLCMSAASAIGALCGVTIALILSLSYFFLCLNKRSGILGEHEFTIEDEGLFEKTDANETLTKWPSITSMRKTKNFILIRINNYLFHILPRRAFSNERHYDEAWAELNKRWREKA